MGSDKKPEQFDLFAPQAPSAPKVARRVEREPPPAPPPERKSAPDPGTAAGGIQVEPRTYRVAEIVRFASRSLEARFGDIWVEGEISNLKAQGHCYFTLKDADAQLPAVMFKAAAARLRFRLGDGLQVRARGRLAIYEPQGKLQLYVDSLEPAGLGALQLAFEQLKRKLEGEGLFDPRRKRPLPFLPRCIGVATSATGAAVRDIVRVATRRGPARLLIAHCLVQGDGAPADIVRAIAALERRPEVEVIIVGRGGGSVEDLWAFNDELVARAIARCRVPVISAVGHEVDFTIADFVADKRAATPSQAAELAVPVHDELVRRVDDLSARLERAARRALADARQRLDLRRERAKSLLHRNIDAHRRELRAAADRLATLHPRARLARHRALLVELTRRLQRPLPEQLTRSGRALATLQRRADAAMQQALARRRRAFEGACGKLDALSPLKVLERGYGLVRGPDGALLTDAAQVSPGDPIGVQVARGRLSARVERVERDPGRDGGKER